MWLAQLHRALTGPRPGRRAPSKPHRKRLVLEALEDRRVPSTLTVTSAADNGASGTLRGIIASANNHDTIDCSVSAEVAQGVR